MKHQKHAKLAQPIVGNFGRNEWAILGTTCGNIQKLARELCPILSPNFKTAYVDADHQAGDLGEDLLFSAEYTDKIQYNRLDFRGKMTAFQNRAAFNSEDIILINGNHFAGKQQIVVLDPKKNDSLERKLNRLTDVKLFLSLDTEGVTMPDFLFKHLPNAPDIPVFKISETLKIAQFISENTVVPSIKGLILAGGQSLRMGEDKGLMNYHGKPQWSILTDFFKALNIESYVSIRYEQNSQLFDNQRVITDSFSDLGPFGAILSAFRTDPNAAWLVVACDLPLLDLATLKTLILSRNKSKIATTFRSPESSEGFPEPLITIWEPKSYAILLQFLAQGVSCPRKVLINSETNVIDPSVPSVLMNANTPEERDEALILLKK